MTKICGNRYKICRETTGLTQYEASELLHISERSLSDYENDKTKVPEDIVANMADIYKAPLLGWWHLRETSLLGRFLPEFVMPQTNGDMAFQLVLADDQLTPAVDMIKKIMSNGQIDECEWDDFYKCIEAIKSVNSKLFSAIVYAKQRYSERKEEK